MRINLQGYNIEGTPEEVMELITLQNQAIIRLSKRATQEKAE